MGAVPRYPDRLLTDDEDIVVELRPHWRVLIPAVLWTALGLGAIAAAASTPGTTREPWLVPMVALLAAVFVLGLAVPPLVRWLFTQYVLTTERIVVRSGVISRSGTEIPLESISNVLFTQSVVERLLGYGDVVLESAGESGQSRLTDVPDPEAFQSRVYAAREDRSLHFTRTTGTGQRDVAAQLESLVALHDRGALTHDEFEAQKRRLLDEGRAVDEG